MATRKPPAPEKVKAPSIPYRPDFLERLRDREYAAAYIQSVIDEGDMQLLLATLRDLAEAYGGMTTVAKKAQISRTHFYKMLSPEGNPTVQNLDTVLKAMGLRLTVVPATA
jgi:probable addiction module antidote protein